jgi:copper ion binding protein
MERQEGAPVTEHTITVEGMTCGGCEQAVERAVGSLEGLRAVDADHAAARVTVRFDPGSVAPAAIETRIRDAGYRVAT